MARPARSPRDELERLVDDLHRSRLRVWSIVITLFGDAVIPRGGEVWLGVVAALMERLRVNPGTLGAAMSRLTAEDWLTRVKLGRRSHYRLAEAGRQAFEEAARRIYGLDRPDWTGTWAVRVALDADTPEAAAAWADAGFGRLGPNTFLRPEERPARPCPPGASIVFSAEPEVSAELAALTVQAFPFAEAEARNAAFIRQFAPLAEGLRAGSELPPEDAMAARTLLIHGFRRVVLKDPRLPPTAVPEGSARTEARRLVGDVYRRLLPASEAWLDGWTEAGLGAPSERFFGRFGGLHHPEKGLRKTR